MKFTIFNIIVLFVFILQLASLVTAVAVDTSAAQNCGILGLFDKSILPADFNPTDARQCANHPLNLEQPTPSANAVSSDAAGHVNHLFARECNRGNKPWGCWHSYCWKNCNYNVIQMANPWCWTAERYGYGHWSGCNRDDQCDPKKWNLDCGKGCKKGSKACDCSC